MANTALATTGRKDAKGKVTPPSLRLRPTKLDTLQNVRTELGKLYRDARQGRMPCADATRLAFILGEIRKALVDEVLEGRITALEARDASK